MFNQCGAVLKQWKVFFEACKFEFNFEWNKGYDKGWLKNLYLSNLTSVLGDLKFIGKLIQRSTTSMLMISSNFNDFGDELTFESEEEKF